MDSVKQGKMIERVKAAWGGGRGGKLESVIATDEPREFEVMTLGAFEDKATATLLAHGLKVIEVQPSLLSPLQAAVRVRVTDDLWKKIEVETDSQPLAAAPLETAGDEAADLLQEMRRALVDARELIEQQQERLLALTSAPKRIYVYMRLDHPVTDDAVVTKRRQEGYQVVESNFIMGTDGTPYYCATMERREHPTEGGVPYRMIRSAVPLENAAQVTRSILDHMGGVNLFERLREKDEQELAPAVTRLAEAMRSRD